MIGNESSKVALVTGATGYVGSNVARRLASNGWKVHVVARKGSKLTLLQEILGSVTFHRHDGSTESMFSILENTSPDVVFHLASFASVSHSPEDIESMLTSNIIFGTQLAEAMIANSAYLLINTGTYSQHYANKEYSPSSLYDATKQAFKDIVTFYTETTPLRVITLELFDNYGPGDPRPKIMALLQKAVREKKPFAMTRGEQLLDMVYIDDIVDAFEWSAECLLKEQALKDEVYSLSSLKPISLKGLVQVFENVAGCKLPIQWGGRSYRPREIMVPWNKGTNLPGWKAKVSLEEGIKKVIDSDIGGRLWLK